MDIWIDIDTLTLVEPYDIETGRTVGVEPGHEAGIFVRESVAIRAVVEGGMSLALAAVVTEPV